MTQRLTESTVAGYTLKNYGSDNLVGLYRDYDVFFAHLQATERLGRLEAMLTLRPVHEWKEEYGKCLWWAENAVDEKPSYIGSPMEADYNEQMIYFVEIPKPFRP